MATGTACLGKYVVPQPGPVLVYLAEDALLIVRERVEGMARYRGLELDSVEVHVITGLCCGSIAIAIACDSGRQPGGFGLGCWCWIHW